MNVDELMDFDLALIEYDPVIGMEVHVELATKSKMFCGCATVFGSAPNTQVCPVCLGLPGALPVVNKAAVEFGIKIGLALNCTINSFSQFARKNYFYPDQPKNYQISQYDKPIAINGFLDIPFEAGTFRVEIERAHLEEDTGKATHMGSATGRIQGAAYSLLDYNRAGVPLVEIVTKPIINAGAKAPEIARAYVKALRDLILNLGVSDAKMNQGSLRCDVNLSLKKKNTSTFGIRTETKNVNSLKSIAQAVRYEITRQAAILTAGQVVVQETRHFQEIDGTTLAGRRKETSEDYRYFPDPDLPPLTLDSKWIEKLRADLPKPPWLLIDKYRQEWQLSEAVMRDLQNLGAIDLIAQTVALGADSNSARAWWSGFLAQKANALGVELSELNITPAQLAKIIALIAAGKLNNKLAQQVIEKVIDSGQEPETIIAETGLQVVSDESTLIAAVKVAIAENPAAVASIKAGKIAAIGKLIGAVMHATKGQAPAVRVKELILELIGK